MATTHRCTSHRSLPRSPRALWRALVIAAFAAAALVGGAGTHPAQAHVPIILLVMAPHDGQTVDANPQVVIYAQRTLGGVDQVAYTLTLDQHPIDPVSGHTGASGPAQIRAGQQAHVPLHDLAPGPHRLAIHYRPDSDEPAKSDAVEFTVRGATGQSLPVVPVATALGVALAAAAGAATWWTRRRRSRNAGPPVGAASGSSKGEQERRSSSRRPQ